MIKRFVFEAIPAIMREPLPKRARLPLPTQQIADAANAWGQTYDITVVAVRRIP